MSHSETVDHEDAVVDAGVTDNLPLVSSAIGVAAKPARLLATFTGA
jgi:hypothetical protein